MEARLTRALSAEGWKLTRMPGPEFEGEEGQPGAGTEAPYYNWVDQYDTFGLGKDTPIATGNQSDSLAALNGDKWTVLRVAYPLGYFAKGMDGRVDDPNTGWKGKGLWSTFSDRAATAVPPHRRTRRRRRGGEIRHHVRRILARHRQPGGTAQGA